MIGTRLTSVMVAVAVGLLSTACKPNSYRLVNPGTDNPSHFQVLVSVEEKIQSTGPRKGVITVAFLDNDRLASGLQVSYVGAAGTPIALPLQRDPADPSRGVGYVSKTVQLTTPNLTFNFRYGNSGRLKQFTVKVPTASHLRITGPISGSRLRFACRDHCFGSIAVDYLLAPVVDSLHSNPKTKVTGYALVDGLASNGGPQDELLTYYTRWPSNVTTKGRHSGRVFLTRVIPADEQDAQGFESITRDEWHLISWRDADFVITS